MKDLHTLADELQRATLDADRAAFGLDVSASTQDAAERVVAAAKAALASALPDNERHLASTLRSMCASHARHLRMKRIEPGERCLCYTLFCESESALDMRRRTVVRHAITPGHPVALAGFSQVNGAAWVKGFFPMGWGGPRAGNFLPGGVDPDAPDGARIATWSTRTTAFVEDRLLRNGWQVVCVDDAVEAVTAAGYRLGIDRRAHEELYADETGAQTWRESRHSETVWEAFVVRAPQAERAAARVSVAERAPVPVGAGA